MSTIISDIVTVLIYSKFLNMLTEGFYSEPTQLGRFTIQDSKLPSDFSQDYNTKDHGIKAIAFSQSSMHDSHSYAAGGPDDINNKSINS